MSKLLFIKNTIKKSFIKKPANIKILVSHDFLTLFMLSGSNFSNFYEWMIHIGKLSNITEHDWYVKTHPTYKGKFGINQFF